jgi:hypothetical protein
MKRVAWMSLVVVVMAVTIACSRGHRAEHALETETRESPPPTPDTTPIPALRTPAGLVLGVEATSTATTAVAPATTPTPVP